MANTIVKMKRKNLNNVDTSKKNFIILRVSESINENEQISFEKQLSVIKKIFKLNDKNDYEIVEENGSSAYNKSNYYFTMNDLFRLKNRNFYYYCIDRFSRTPWQQHP